MSWDPEKYLKFRGERTRPSVDLVGRIVAEDPATVIDLGCGPGNSTAVLRGRWPGASITGLDSDPAMLRAALRSDPYMNWMQGDVASWHADGAFDVVYSNAVLQWVPDHAELIPRLFRAVAPGGALAFQIPTRVDSAIYADIDEVANDPRWRAATEAARNALVDHEPAFYYDLLCTKAERLDVWTTEYQHALDGPEAVLDWMRSTRLRPFLDALPDEADRRAFEAALLGRIAAAFPRRPDGKVLFPFRRLFVIAYRGRD
ncbi:Trans-aconitate 2-methyltransferase [Aquisphaera giovannonii]|uniref:Trans-aconitate 2-methyltransferase n=1 Tax=Aquisphaera giovannonii TaxID=406548 RepID=A0A5B9W779_9BACT|nr:methyltransferase domain-containing protein [Aquisphaera giovannonii]QEH35989.1 Trans-aconitate 2-methyltransferase [Aquisphaera giovannonii]